VLIYGAIEVPFSQPRALFGGHFLGALTGICITKLFHLLPTEERFQSLLWLAGSLSCATSVVVMQITGTTHPPAGKSMRNPPAVRLLIPLLVGATALLAAVNTEVREMGWYYLPVVLLTSTLALVVAVLIDNIQRRYPTFWFQPNSPPPPPPVTKAPVDTPPTSTAASMLIEEKPRDTANTFPV